MFMSVLPSRSVPAEVYAGLTRFQAQSESLPRSIPSEAVNELKTREICVYEYV